MTLNYALKRSLPVMAGYIVLGIGFGILLEAKGYGVGWALLMSTLIYAGSMQYVAIDLITGGASLIQTALMTVMVNARHLFYGISMIDKYKGTGVRKLYLIFSLTDETYSLVCDGAVPEDVNEKQYYFLLSLFNQCYWITGSVIGSLIGSFIAFDTAGIDFSMTALFVVVFVDQWRNSKDHTSAIIGVISSVICLLIFGPDRFILPSMLVITILLTELRKVITPTKIVVGGSENE